MIVKLKKEKNIYLQEKKDGQKLIFQMNIKLGKKKGETKL
jgi:hypothetical protein